MSMYFKLAPWMGSSSTMLNFIAIALAITGILTPIVGALVHNAGSVLVIGILHFY